MLISVSKIEEGLRSKGKKHQLRTRAAVEVLKTKQECLADKNK